MLDGGELALLMPLEPVMPGLTASQISFGAKILAEPALGELDAADVLSGVEALLREHTADGGAPEGGGSRLA